MAPPGQRVIMKECLGNTLSATPEVAGRGHATNMVYVFEKGGEGLLTS